MVGFSCDGMCRVVLVVKSYYSSHLLNKQITFLQNDGNWLDLFLSKVCTFTYIIYIF